MPLDEPKIIPNRAQYAHYLNDKAQLCPLSPVPHPPCLLNITLHATTQQGKSAHAYTTSLNTFSRPSPVSVVLQLTTACHQLNQPTGIGANLLTLSRVHHLRGPTQNTYWAHT